MSTVLIVDDDPDIRASLAELVGLLLAARIVPGELTVATAATGEEAVALASGAKPVAVVVMDVNLPGIDGVEAFFRIAGAHGGKPVPTVFLTGYAGSGPLHARLDITLAAGAVAVLGKPVSGAALLAAIERALEVPITA